MPKSKSVVVVGGGVVGMSCAYFLARSGCEVTVLEGRAKEASNCSTGNAGMVVPSHFVPLAAPGVIGQGLRWMLKPESPFSITATLLLETLAQEAPGEQVAGFVFRGLAPLYAQAPLALQGRREASSVGSTPSAARTATQETGAADVSAVPERSATMARSSAGAPMTT